MICARAYINKASSDVSDDASLGAFYVQSVPGGADRASRSRRSEQKRKSSYTGVKDRSRRSTRACGREKRGESTNGGDYKM